MHQPWVRPHGVSRGQARVAFQFHGSLDLGIIVLRYVTLCNGRSRAVSSLARPGGPANATSAAQRDSRLFVGIPGASRLFGGRCRAGCPALMWRARSSAALSPTPAPRRAVCSRRSCRVARSGSCRRTPGTAVSLLTEPRTAPSRSFLSRITVWPGSIGPDQNVGFHYPPR
jgi:hypothetical protein